MGRYRAWRRRRDARRPLIGWDRGHIYIEVYGREAQVEGEMLVADRKGDPRFVVYGAASWKDGGAMASQDIEAATEILEELVASRAAAIEIDGPIRPRRQR